MVSRVLHHGANYIGSTLAIPNFLQQVRFTGGAQRLRRSPIQSDDPQAVFSADATQLESVAQTIRCQIARLRAASTLQLPAHSTRSLPQGRHRTRPQGIVRRLVPTRERINRNARSAIILSGTPVPLPRRHPPPSSTTAR